MAASSSRSSVPPIGQVRPGTVVDIILKADQVTGKTVQGIVKDVLTRSNHPRGVKVRLVDGRIGRVQKLASFSASENAGPDASTESPDIADGTDEWVMNDGSQGYNGHGRRTDGEGNGQGTVGPAQETSLGQYIKATELKTKKSRGSGGSTGPQTNTALCPVCGDFEGDEDAVAHHVGSHFDS